VNLTGTSARLKSITKLLPAAAVLLALMSAATVSAQKKGVNWMELPRKDAEKILNESPWSHTQVDTDISELFYSPTKAGTAGPARGTATTGSTGNQQSINNNRADRGAVNQAVDIKYRICFLSAKPVREAFAKMVLSSQPQADDHLVTRLQSFVDRDFSPYIVIAVTVEANDARFSRPIMQAMNSANTGSLKNTAYLEREDGKRLFLISYLAPIQDGLGAKFVFPRTENGAFFLSGRSESVRFVAEFNDSFKLNMRFKVADMMFDDKLEY
jgi:hypothetical protein